MMEREAETMSRKILCLILALCAALAGCGAACALELPEEVTPVNPEEIFRGLEERRIVPDLSPRAGGEGEPESGGMKIPTSTDKVAIDEANNRFSIDTGRLKLETSSPFGWLYFTQDAVSLWKTYDGGGFRMAMKLIEAGVHLYLISLPDYQVQIEFAETDLLGISEYVRNTDRLSDSEVDVACVIAQMAGWQDVTAVTLGNHRYLAVRDGMETYGTVLYEAMIDDNVCLMRVCATENTPLEEQEVELAESVIAGFDLSAV